MSTGADVAKQTPVWRFALFFKTYGIALGVIVAATPILSQALSLLPSYASNRNILTFTTTLVSFLCVAFLFSVRRSIGEAIFPQRRALPKLLLVRRRLMSIYIPAALAVLSLTMLFVYLELIQTSLSETALQFAYVDPETRRPLKDVLREEDRVEGYLFGVKEDRYKIMGWAYTALSEPPRRLYGAYLWNESADLILSTTPAAFIYHGLAIALVYTLIFLFSVAAFTWLGIVDYIRDELSLDDRDLLKNPYRRIRELEFKVPEVADRGVPGERKTYSVYFALEYDPAGSAEGYLEYTGPYCGQHNRLLKYDGRVNERHRWLCSVLTATGELRVPHKVMLDYDRHEMRSFVRSRALEEIDNDRVRRGAPTVVRNEDAK